MARLFDKNEGKFYQFAVVSSTAKRDHTPIKKAGFKWSGSQLILELS
jgi:hypothetical protein